MTKSLRDNIVTRRTIMIPPHCQTKRGTRVVYGNGQCRRVMTGRVRSRSRQGKRQENWVSSHYRTMGITPKFARNSDLLTFQKMVMDHLTQHGMDTITYLVDPVDKSNTVTIVSKHAQFTLKTVSKLTKQAILMRLISRTRETPSQCS